MGKRQIFRIFQFLLISTGAWNLRAKGLKDLWTLYNLVFWFFKYCRTLGDICKFCFQKWSNIWEIIKKAMSLKCRPPIFVYQNGRCYQCEGLTELVWMYCMCFFFILDLLKRYRKNTAKNRSLLWGLLSP